MKILIISSFFPPQNSIASLRPYSWAKHWSRSGHDVTVLTVPKKRESTGLTLPFDGFEVIELAVPGMSFIAKLLGSNSSAPTCSGLPTSNDKISMSFRLKRSVKKLLVRLQKQYGFAYGCRMPDPLDFWGGVAIKAIEGRKWDFVISTAGPYSVHGPAYVMRKKGLANCWIADWRDLWVDNHIFPGLPVIRTFERFLERRWCLAADVLTTVSEPLADVLRAKYGKKVAVIYNGFDLDDYAQLPTESAFPDDGVFRIVYTGSIYAKRQDPTLLFQVLRELAGYHEVSSDQLRVIFCGNNADVRDLAQKEGVSKFVEYFGFLDRNKALHMQRDASALLLLEFESIKVKGILTGKLFEYLFAGPLIWAVGVSSESSIGEILSETKRGVAVGRDAALLREEILTALTGKGGAVLKNKQQCASSLEVYSRQAQAIKVLNLVDDLCSK